MYKEQTQKVLKYLKETKGYGEVLFLGLRGSRHLGLATEESDYDFTAVVMPSLRNLVFKEKAHQSASHVVSPEVSVQVTTLQGLSLSLEKVSFNMFEMFTMLTYVSPKVETLLEKVQELYRTDEAHSVFEKNFYFTGAQHYKRSKKDLPDTEKSLAKAVLFKRLLNRGESMTVYETDQLPQELKDEYLAHRTGERVLDEAVDNELSDYYESESVRNHFLDRDLTLPVEMLSDVEKEVYAVLSELFDEFRK